MYVQAGYMNCETEGAMKTYEKVELCGLQGSSSHPGRFTPGRSVSAPTNMTSVGPTAGLDTLDKS
jgi:hypothetical protein